MTNRDGITEARRRSRARQAPAGRRAVAAMLACCMGSASCAPTLNTQLPDPSTLTEPRLNVGDHLRIEVWRQPEFSGEFIVGQDSALTHPLYQDVKIAGLSLTVARARLVEFLATFLQGARLVVEPLHRVTVSGEVRQPSLLHVPRGATIAEAIALAGGPTADARLNHVVLVRGGMSYNLSLTEDQLETYGDVRIESGDQLFVSRVPSFNVWRDLLSPVTSLAVLTLTIIRITRP